jgi:hypothetical protein
MEIVEQILELVIKENLAKGEYTDLKTDKQMGKN